uniref:Uncharacterized protein n=1 Tax=Clastoptera arizonana TaxID=38151 RepID=A0A1B6E7C2_9HEMI
MANSRQGQNPQQTVVATSQANTSQMGIQGGDQRGQQGQSGMMGQRPPQFNQHIEAARKENLAKIQQLRQTLELAQQQELKFKSQLEMFNHMQIQQLQQTLEQAQQQENHFQAQQAQMEH